MIEGTQFGSIQGYVGPPESLAGLDTRFEILSAPGLFKDLAHANRTLQEPEFNAAFLQQDLRNLPAEFRVTATWKPYLVSLAHLQSRVTGFVFSKELLAADKSAHKGKVIAEAVGAEVHGSVTEAAPAGVSD